MATQLGEIYRSITPKRRARPAPTALCPSCHVPAVRWRGRHGNIFRCVNMRCGVIGFNPNDYAELPDTVSPANPLYGK